jgi:hypothetical protein
MGKSSARAATQLGERNAGRINSGYDTADSSSLTGYNTAQNRLMPYAQGGQRGYDTYTNALGLNGEPARQQAFQSFESDPFLAYARQNSGNEVNNIFRRYNAQGIGNSGASMLAVSRAAGERAQGDVNSWLNRMMQMGQQGQGIAGQQAGLDTNYYGGVADRAVGRVNALNQNDAQATMAANNARMAGVNNLLSGLGTLGGTVFSAFAPGAGGMSAAGNMAKMFGGGGGGGGNADWINPDTGTRWGR